MEGNFWNALYYQKLKERYIFKSPHNINELNFFQISIKKVFGKLEGFLVAGCIRGRDITCDCSGFPQIIFGLTPPVNFDSRRASLILVLLKDF